MLDIDIIKKEQNITAEQKMKAQIVAEAQGKKRVIQLVVDTPVLAAIARGEVSAIQKDIKPHWIVRFTKHKKHEDVAKMPIFQIQFNKFEYIEASNGFGKDVIYLKAGAIRVKLVNKIPVFEIDIKGGIFANYDYKTKYQDGTGS